MLLFLGIFLYYPAIQVVLLSLKRRIFPLPQEQNICLGNYVSIANDPIYQNSFTTTAFITVALVAITMVVALLIATLATQDIRGGTVYRTLLIWPFALSPLVSGVIFLALFRDGPTGGVNYLLIELFDYDPQWLRDRDLAPWVVIFTGIWNGLGFNILFYIGGIAECSQGFARSRCHRWRKRSPAIFTGDHPAVIAIYLLFAGHECHLCLLRHLRERLMP